MSSQKIFQQQADNLSTLQELLDLAKNPQAITAAHETARKQMQLTEAEELKMKQAREFMSAYDAHVAKLAEQRTQINNEVSKYTIAVENFNQSIMEQNAALDTRKIALDAKEGILENLLKQHEDNIKKLAADKISGDARAKINDEAMRQREEKCQRCEAATIAERERLVQTRYLLDKRAKAIAEAIKAGE